MRKTNKKGFHKNFMIKIHLFFTLYTKTIHKYDKKKTTIFHEERQMTGKTSLSARHFQ